MIGLLVAAHLWLARVSFASEQSERLYSRGLVDFHVQRYADALKLFTEAVEADPNDAYALYYRGATQGRLGNFSAALKDLRAALAKKPDLEQANLEIGVALVQTGAFSDALPFLERAQRIADAEAQASLYLGIAQLRLAQLDAARQSFARAADRDATLILSARYYQGIIDFRQEKWQDAEAQFSFVAGVSPTSEMGREAGAFLTRLHEGRQPAQRPYQLYAAFGFQYDSNVKLAPSDDAIKTQFAPGKQGDGRITLGAGGAYVPWRTQQVEFSVGYEFYQSLHFDLDAFNLQDHRPSAQVVVNLGPVQLGMLGRYDYYFVRADSFLQEASALPWVTIPEQSFGRTEVFYRMRRRDFKKKPFAGLRDAFNHAPGIRQYVYLGAPERYVSVAYRFDREDPINAIGNQFAYDGHEVSAGFGWAFPIGVTTELDYAYRTELYASQSENPQFAPNGRHDDQHQVIAAVHKNLTEYLGLTAAYFGTFNHSNDARFEYDRSIASLSVDVRY